MKNHLERANTDVNVCMSEYTHVLVSLAVRGLNNYTQEPDLSF